MIDRLVPKIVEMWENWRKIKKGKGRKGKFAAIRSIDVDNIELAFIVLRTVFSNLEKSLSKANLSSKIGESVNFHFKFKRFYEESKSQATAIRKKIQKGDKTVWLWKKNINNSNISNPFSPLIRKTIGMFFVECLIDLGVLKSFKKKRMYFIKPTEDIRQFLNRKIHQYKNFFPIRMPMVIPPSYWTNMWDGGRLIFKRPLVRLKEHMEENKYPTKNLPLEPVNKLQSVSWKINKYILNTIEKMKDPGGVAGLPVSKEAEVEPPWIPKEKYERLKEEDEEELKRLLYERRKQREINQREEGKRVSLSLKLWVANKMKNYDKIWFPPFLDYRGRFYYNVDYLTPQSEDIGKSLLLFGEGKKIDTEDAVENMKVNLCNLWGNDKISFDDRIEWTNNNIDRIRRSAEKPLEERWWTEADEPFQFLAAAKDFHEWKKDPENHLSYIPMYIDGSCNGLQHYSALLRDEKAAKFVNLLPSEEPSDIYKEVAEEVKREIENDRRAITDPQLFKFRDFWLQRIDRNLLKRNIMTLPYGVTKYGMKNQLIEDQKQQDPRYYEDVDTVESVEYLVNFILKVIRKFLPSALSGMEFFKEVAKRVGGKDINWETPTGFLVQQSYKKTKAKKIRTVYGTKQLRLDFRENTGEVNKVKQKGGIAPNFIHSMDASHLMRVSDVFLDYDKRWLGVIHDSFSTHYRDVNDLHDTIRDEFINLYKKDRLLEFKEKILQDHPEVQMPPLPEKGSLDLEKVRKSLYFFH